MAMNNKKINSRRVGKRFGPDSSKRFAKRAYPNDWNRIQDTVNGTRRVYIKNTNGHRSNPDSR